MSLRLEEVFFTSARKFPNRIAMEELLGKSITYQELEKNILQKAAFLASNGIGENSRVAIMAPKTIETVSTFIAILQTGAAYIPIDLTIPTERLHQILTNLDPQAFIAPPEHFPSEIPCQQQIMPGSITGELSISFFPSRGSTTTQELAYILYTSGSTGAPKGVCITHTNARAFTDWSLKTFSLNENDRFSSIAPFHFDLSVFDLYVTLGCGGTIVLIDDTTSKNARLLGAVLEEKKISVIYATPSLLSLLLNFGKIENRNFSNLKTVLFAGEVFPVQHLHPLMKCWNNTQFFNLYGPTETNVCTWHEIPRPIDESRTTPYPIGKICSHLKGKISNEGELLIAGENVTSGYWQRSDLNAKVFVSYENIQYYRTGDRIEIDTSGNLIYTGRIDRMIKKRGYRIEPEEIETTLLLHPDILEAAVIGGKDEEGYTLMKSFLSIRDKATISMIEIKQHCLKLLPAYMIPEQIIFLKELPKTSSGKVDLKELEKI